MIGNRFYTWFKNYYQWVGGAFNETLLLPLVRATAGLRAGAIRYDEATGTVETYDGTNWNPIPSASGFVPNSRTITINGTTFDLSTNRIYSVGTVTSVGLNTGSAGTDINVSGSPVNVSGNITLNIPTASATNRGALSSADWTTFNNKVSTSRQLTINGTAFDLSADRTWSVGTVTSVAASAPLSVSGSATTTPVITISQANSTTNGFLSSTDWNTFNNKQNALTLTTTGNSGASTLLGATLNVPEYTLTGLGGVPTTRTLTINGTALDLSTNRSWSVGTVTSVGLTSATSGVTITDSPVTVSGTIGIAIATANGSQQGLLSSTDWTTFNNKQNAITLTTNGTSGAASLVGATLNVPQYQAQGNYITSLTGEATASGPGAASVTLSTTAVTGKLLTGLNLSGGGTIAATDSILQAFGKVQNQISAMVGGVMYQGTWNASTNTPTLTSSVGTKGNYYIVDVSGTTNLNGITDWRVGDWAIFNGSTWDKVDNTDAVSSVNGFTGAVSLTTSHIAEGTNLYYLDSRSRTAISLTTTGNSGAATYDNVSGIINVPQYTLTGLGGVPTTRQLTINGTAFDLSADRSWSVGTVTSVGLNSTTSGVTITNTPVTSSGALTINIATASGSQNGLLSSTDWTTFNNKQNALTNPVTGAGMTTQLAYFNGTTTITSASLFYDVANVRLGINKSTPSVTLDVSGTAAISLDLTARTLIAEGTGSYNAGLVLKQYSSANFYGAGYTQLYAVNTTNLQIVYNQASSQRRAELSAALLNDGDNFQYLFPRSNGTLALTSNINSAVSGSTGQVAYFNGTNSVTGESNLFWDAANDRLGIGTATPSTTLVVSQQSDNTNVAIFHAGGGTTNRGLRIATFAAVNDNAGVTLDAQASTGILAFATAGTERMRITSGGNVGIGTTSPVTRLDVNGSIRAVDLLISNDRLYLNGNRPISDWISDSLTAGYSSTNSYGWVNSANNLVLGTNGTERMRITSGGNVGIGINNPAQRLDVGGIVQATSFYNLNSGVIRLYNANNTNFATISSNTGTTDGTISLVGGSGNGMFIANGGNVGIGESNPASYRLQVKGPDGQGIQYEDTNGVRTLLGSFTSEAIVGTLTNHAVGFWTNNSRKMIITSGGNVGIGTTSPAATLDVRGTIRNEVTSNPTNAILLQLTNQTTTSPNGCKIAFDVFNVGAAAIGMPSNSADLVFYVNGNNTERMRITSGGSIGIGTASPDIFSRGDGFDVGISSAGLGASQNMSLQLNAGGSAGRGAQIYMGQGGTRHFTISSNVNESTIGTTSNTPLRIETNSLERLRAHANGGLKFNPQSAAPTAEAGTVYYDSDDNKLKVYNGTSWVDLH